MKKYKFTTQTKEGVLDFYEKTEEELDEKELQHLMNQFIAEFNELPKKLKIMFIDLAIMQIDLKNDSPQNDDTSEL